MADEKAKAPARKKAAAMSVHKALREARVELCGAGIGKDKQAPEAVGGYKFRGIDEIYNVIGPLMAKYGLSMLPQAQDVRHTTFEVTRRRNNQQVQQTMQHFLVKVRYLLVADGAEDELEVIVYGEASDANDKGMNKAMTSAYKNAVFQTFAPPLDGVADMDSESTEDPAGPPAKAKEQPKSKAPAKSEAPPADAPVDKETGEIQQGEFISAEDAKSVQMAVANAGIDETGFFAWIKVKKGAYTQIPAGKLGKINETLKEKLREKTVADAKALAEQTSPPAETVSDDDLNDDIPF